MCQNRCQTQWDNFQIILKPNNLDKLTRELSSKKLSTAEDATREERNDRNSTIHDGVFSERQTVSSLVLTADLY